LASGITIQEISVQAISTVVVELDRDVLFVRDGELSIALTDRDAITVRTPALRLNAVGAAFRVDVEATRTSVFVERGTVELGDGSVLAAGESMMIGPAREARSEVEAPHVIARARARAPAFVPVEPEITHEEPEQEQAPPAREDRDVGALIARADAERRAGRLREALEIYTDVANDPLGGAFQEEAMLRRATLLESLGSASDALAALGEIAERFPRGELAPERVLLEVKIHLEQREPSRAATSLEQLDDQHTLQILHARIDVARALASSQPNRALALIRPALSNDVSEAVRRSAVALEAEIRGREIK